MSDEHDEREMPGGDDNFAEMLEQSLGRANRRLEIGQKVDARILQIGAEWAFLDVGQKGEGVLAVKELQDVDGNLTASPGDTISAYFMSREGGELRFTTRIGGGVSGGTAQIEEAWRAGIPVDGRVDQEVKGGYEVRLTGQVRAFCPHSQIGRQRAESADEVIGTTLPFRITRYDENGRNIVVSHRVLLEEEKERQREELRQTLKEGDRVKGTVAAIRDFGAFVDIGGIEGLLPISEISYGRVDDVREVLQVGQELELVVKRLDWDGDKFSFSLRDTLADPWTGFAKSTRVGDTVTGKVSRLVPFGAFVTLDKGVDGLVHISELGRDRHVKHPKDVLEIGQVLNVTVQKIDLEQRRISLVPALEGESPEVKSYSDEPAAGTGLGTFADLIRAAQEKKGKSR